MDDPSLYPGEVDPDGKIKADQEIMEDEMEDEMETPPAGYQGQFTLRVCKHLPSAFHSHARVYVPPLSQVSGSLVLLALRHAVEQLITAGHAAGPHDRVQDQGTVRRPEFRA